MRASLKRYPLILGLLVVAEAAVLPSVAAGGQPSAARASASLINPTLRVVQGTATPSGCTFTMTTTLRPGMRALEEDGISIDFTTCRMNTLVGTPVRTPNVVPNGTGVPDSIGTQYSGGYEQAWTTDPVALVTTKQKSYLNWYWNGVAAWGASCDHWEYGGPGWYVNNNHVTSCAVSSNVASAVSTADFGNDTFCAPTHAAVYDRNVAARGSYSGNFTGSASISIDTPTLGCGGFYLTPHTQTFRTLN